MSDAAKYIVQQICRLAAGLADEIERDHHDDHVEAEVRLTVTLVELPTRQHELVTRVEHTRTARLFDGEWQETVATRSEKWA